jgi:poly(ADP-ribose) glycohydrolase ARH3
MPNDAPAEERQARLRDRAAGTLIGCAVGDAVGELAFRHPQRADLHARVAATQTLVYTDDTAMTIALAESLIARGGVETAHLGDSFAAHYRAEPWRGYGPGPPKIFAEAARSGRPYPEIARALYGGEGSLGNGAAMRAGPLGIAYRDGAGLRDAAERAAEITHAHPVGRDAGALLALAVGHALGCALADRRVDPGQLAELLIAEARTEAMRDKLRRVRDLLHDGAGAAQVADAVGRSIQAQESVPFAIYAFLAAPEDPAVCLDTAMGHGGDRDTLAAMAGAIAGAHLGEAALPPGWCARIESAPRLRALGTQLADAFPAD